MTDGNEGKGTVALHDLARNFSLFVLIGGMATGLQYLVLIVLVQWSGVGPTLASSLGYLLSAGVNYLLNRHYTFRSSAPHHQAVPRFFTVAVSGLALNAMIMWAGTSVLGMHYLLVQITATGVVLFFNYTAHKHWSFASTAP